MAQKISSKSTTLRRTSTKSMKKASPRSTATKTKQSRCEGRAASAGDEEVTIDRRRKDRRENGEAAASDDSVAPKLERRQKVNRRRQIDPTTCERDYTDQEVEFMNALDDYKRKSGRMFPTCSEVLEVLRGLGYAKLTAAESNALAAMTASVAQQLPATPDALSLATLEAGDVQSNDLSAMTL